MSKNAIGITQMEADRLCRKGAIDHAIEDYRYAEERVCEEFGDKDYKAETEAYYDNIELEAQAEEVGRLEGKLEFYMRYKNDQDDDPEGFRIAKLLLGITEE